MFVHSSNLLVFKKYIYIIYVIQTLDSYWQGYCMMVIAVGWVSLWLLAVSAYFCIAIHTYGKEFGIIHCFHRCCQESSNHEGSRGRAALSILTMSSFGSPFDFAYLEAPFCLSVCWVLHEHLRAKTKRTTCSLCILVLVPLSTSLAQILYGH